MGKYFLYVVRKELRFFSSKPNRKCTLPSCHHFGTVFSRLSRLTQLFNHDEIAVFRRLSRLSRVLNSGPKRKSFTFSYLCYKTYFKSKFLICRMWKYCLFFEPPWIRPQASAVLFPNQTRKAIYPDFRITFRLMIYGRLKNTNYYQTYSGANLLLVVSVNILLLHILHEFSLKASTVFFPKSVLEKGTIGCPRGPSFTYTGVLEGVWDALSHRYARMKRAGTICTEYKTHWFEAFVFIFVILPFFLAD